MATSIDKIFDSSLNKQLLSIPAKRLIEKLDQLKNRREAAAKRWFWELLQNASDYNESVSIRLIVDNDKVCFMHDGVPFSMNDVLNLVQPDSNKSDDKIHKENIGKFGTGLVATHILSSEIHVEGICAVEEKHYQFKAVIDRSSFCDKEQLINDIQKIQSSLKDSFVETQDITGFKTSFSYNLNKSLSSLPQLKAENIDLEYLYQVLPYTLCFMTKVQSVEIADNRSVKSNFYIERKTVEEDKVVFDVVRNDVHKELSYVYYKYNNVSSAICVEEDAVQPYPEGMAKLFCGLPLIGTEGVGMPFVLNSFCFEPTVERESIELEPGSNDGNRDLMRDSIVLYHKMLEYIERNQLNAAYLLTNIRRSYNGTQASNTQFYNYIALYKKEILSHAIARNVDGLFITPLELKLPFNNSNKDADLYAYAKFLFSASLPSEEDYCGWFEATDFTLFTDQKFTVKDLTAAIENKSSIFAFGHNAQGVKGWLRSCLPYFKKCNPYVLQEKRLLPNQCGELCFKGTIYVDVDLPSQLKAIYNQLHDDGNIESVLLDQSFNDLELVEKIYSLDKLASKIDVAIAETYKRNNTDISKIIKPVNELYTWIESSELTKEKLSDWFRWFYPKRASLIVDMLTENQREQAITIAKSGRMDALAKLASADLTEDEMSMLVANVKKLPHLIALMNEKVDDFSYADQETGDLGEEIVFYDLVKKFPKSLGYKVNWDSRDNGEASYDFKVTKGENVVCYVDAKTTKRGVANSESIPFFMRLSQWQFLEILANDTPYIIARVFKGSCEIKYMRISLSANMFNFSSI